MTRTLTIRKAKFKVYEGGEISEKVIEFCGNEEDVVKALEAEGTKVLEVLGRGAEDIKFQFSVADLMRGYCSNVKQVRKTVILEGWKEG